MTPKKREVETLSVRVWPGQLEIVDAAAKALDMDRADYVRFRFIPIAAKDAGVDLPVFPPFNSPGRPGKVSPEVAVAARMAGLPAQEFVNRAIQAGVEAVMRISDRPDALRPESSVVERPAVMSVPPPAPSVEVVRRRAKAR